MAMSRRTWRNEGSASYASRPDSRSGRGVTNVACVNVPYARNVYQRLVDYSYRIQRHTSPGPWMRVFSKRMNLIQLITQASEELFLLYYA